jgi:NADH-quinone oxidoreductase subunit G
VAREDGPETVALLASPQMTNEELFALRRMFRDCLNAGFVEYRVPLLEAVYSDEFLITADKNPNSRGAELIGMAGEGADSILRACEEGRVRYLHICQHDLTRGFDAARVRSALAKVETIVYQGSWETDTARMAHVVLPAAVYAEKQGTFTNLQGRVQQIHAAVPPLGEALPDLDIIALLASEAGVSLPAFPPADVFRQLSNSVAAFAGMTYETMGEQGQPVHL